MTALILPTSGTYDQAARECFKNSCNTVISWFLSSSYAYHCRYVSLLSDEVYDNMSVYILNHYDILEHRHKHLITKDMLRAGTAYNLRVEDYPLIVRCSAEELIQSLMEGRGCGMKDQQ